MGSFVSGSVSYAALDTAPNSTGVNNGKYWRMQPNSGSPIYDRRQVTYPGMDGIFIKKFGYRGRIITCDVFYIAASYDGVMTGIEADRISLTNKLFTITLPWGTTFLNCQLEGFPDGRACFPTSSQRGQLTSVSFSHTGN